MTSFKLNFKRTPAIAISPRVDSVGRGEELGRVDGD